MKRDPQLKPISVLLLLLLLIISIAITACGKETSPVINPVEEDLPTTNDEVATQNDPSAAKNDRFKVIESYEEHEAQHFPLISSIPDRDIYLYGFSNGVILYVDDSGYYYNWYYLTPRFILPRMHLGDFDGDGTEELAVILYVGSGTGVSVEELHIIKIYEDQVLSRDPSDSNYFEINKDYFTDYQFDNYIDQLEAVSLLKTYSENDELMGDLTIGDNIYSISLKDLYSNAPNTQVENNVYFGNVVHFKVESNKLIGEFVANVATDISPVPLPIGTVTAEIQFIDGSFILTNHHFTSDL